MVIGNYGTGILSVLSKDGNGMIKRAESADSFAEAFAHIREGDHAPYDYLAKDGIIDYKGVIFVCDTEKNRLCLGDVSDPKKCLTIALSKGGSLVVNRDNLGDLSKAISMFSPEDINRIMQAMAQDAKVQQMKQEIEDEKSSSFMAVRKKFAMI